MANATITTKGQVTILKEIRDYLNLDTGSKVDFVIDENGIVKLIKGKKGNSGTNNLSQFVIKESNQRLEDKV
jgi:AbrB family looped-hinge helix DNA binding protein